LTLRIASRGQRRLIVRWTGPTVMQEKLHMRHGVSILTLPTLLRVMMRIIWPLKVGLLCSIQDLDG